MIRSANLPDRFQMLDDVDKAIIGQLQEDGRRSYTRIAKELGMSESAVRQRVNRLRAAGVIEVVALTDPLKLGVRLMAMVGVRVSGDVEAVADAVAAIPDVEYVVITTGGYDLLLEVVCEDESHLLSILKQIRTTPGVTATETFIYLKIGKQVFGWARRYLPGGPARTTASPGS